MSFKVVNEKTVKIKPSIISVEVSSDKKKINFAKTAKKTNGRYELKEKCDKNEQKKHLQIHQSPSEMNERRQEINKIDKYDTKFAKPEYNSIKWTIRKLQQVENEVVMKDLKNLPSLVKKNINKKISASLNCAPSETVFKDLVNLSVNEKELALPRQPRPISKTSSYSLARQCSVPPLSLDGISDTADTTSSTIFKSQYNFEYENYN